MKFESVSILATRVTWNADYYKSCKWCNDLILTDFVSNAFSYQYTLFYILYNDVYTMIPECLSKILGQTWEELANCTSHKSWPFLCHVAQPGVRIIKLVCIYGSGLQWDNYYTLPFLVYKATLPIVLT